MNNKLYAYFLENTKEKGIVNSWPDCEKIVSGRKARHKGFKSRKEAEEWLNSGANYDKKTYTRLESGVYFDAGTGRGEAVEVNVTDENGKPLLDEVLPREDINQYGTYKIPEDDITNNYGELLGCYFALKIALKSNIKNIFSDSKLIIDYWSKGHINGEISAKTQNLANEVVNLRREFEKTGGKISHISGDDNPADLGFHS